MDGIEEHHASLVLEIGRSSDLDAICRTVAHLFDMPSAEATLIDETTVWLIGCSGTGPSCWPRSVTVCSLTVQLGADEALVIQDLSEDPRFADNPFVVGEPHLRFYAGVPVALSDGVNVGTLCVLDHVPRRNFGAKEIAELHDLARVVEAYLKLRQGHVDEEKERRRAQQLLAAKDDALREASRASLREASDRRRAEEDRRISEERLAVALDCGSDGLWDFDLTTGHVDLTGPWLSIMGFEEGEIAAHISAWEHLTHPDDLPNARSAFSAHLKGLTPKYECEYRIRTKSGDHVWTLARGKVVARDENGRACRVVGTHTDITKRKESEAQIAHLALHDPLTGLPNRTFFHDRLNDEINRSGRAELFAVLVCDLDRFKIINDTMGHAAGDTLLRIVADRLLTSVREGDTVARLGGDEFAIILHGTEQPEVPSVIAERIVAAIEEPCEIEGRNVAVGISVGLAICDTAGATADGLVRNADLALYRAKAEGRNGYRCFEPGMDVLAAESIMLEHDLRDAVRRGDFVLHYQPVLDLNKNTVCGFEALMRWQHPTRGVLPPDLFIPLAEETGLIVILGEWALWEACRQAKLWPKSLRMAVNVSALQFRQPGRLQRSVVAALAASGLEPARLELEVTESVLIQNAEAVIACLRGLRELGVRIALDDFGTGYSSLAYLRRFPFDKIKIDRSFVREIGDPQTAAIVAAVIGLGARVGADVTAEGVETSDQRRQIHAAGCTQLQGFLFSRPLPADEAGAIASGGLRSIAA